MKALLNSHILFAVHMIIVAVVIVIAAWSVHSTKERTTAIVVQNIESQVALLSDLSEKTDRNQADETIANIIVDCPSRAEFESLLAQLHVLSHKQLIKVQQHFDACGSFFAERKALMVARLAREYMTLETHVSLLQSLGDETGESYFMKEWKSLVELEQNRSSLLNEQVDIQHNIISALIAGSGVRAPQIADELARAQEIAESLEVLNKQIDTLRTTINT